MSPKLRSTHVTTKTETKTEPNGTVIKTITTTTTEKFTDGSIRKKINVKTQTTTPGSGRAQTAIDPSTTSAPKAEITTPDDFIQLCLNQHNKFRAKHHAPPLIINRELCKVAQAWANVNAKEDRMYHSPCKDFGENLYYCSEDVKGDHPVSRWYSEIKDYDFKRNEAHNGTGHFTQVIWKQSKELGVAFARARTGNFYVVTEYSPPGNWVGQYTKNVLPE